MLTPPTLGDEAARAGDNPAMEFPTLLATLEREGMLLHRAAARAAWDAEVPSCPEWTVRDLVQHIGVVHRWAGSHVLEGRSEDDIEQAAPPGDDTLLDWYATGHARLVDALASKGPQAAAWHFLPAPSGAAFWARRQAHETTIHRVDAELAAGTGLSPIDKDFAADGVDEVLSAFYARRPSRMTADEPFSFGLRATDVDRGWRTVVTAEGPVTAGLSEPADVVVSAPVHELYLLVWNRIDHRDLATTGDVRPLDQWHERAHIVWA
jgi:uncharacterized protein (TIGR03083 family)